MKYDFSGYATKNDMLCTDGRTIQKGAFEHSDGVTVPLVWSHNHKDPKNILGNAVLEHREDGVYAYCTFNDTETAETTKKLVMHGDITQLSIYANKLVEQAKSVFQGTIREVSLVVTGANPGASIDNLVFAHADGGLDFTDDTMGIIYTGEKISLAHEDAPAVELETESKLDVESLEHVGELNTDDLNGEDDMLEHSELENAENMTIQEIFDTLTEEQTDVANIMLAHAAGEIEDEDLGNGIIEHADGDKTIKEIFDTLTDVQKNVVYAMIGYVLEQEGEAKSADMKQSDEIVEEVIVEEAVTHADAIVEEETIVHSAEGGTIMKKSIFDNEAITTEGEQPTLTHADFSAIIKSAEQSGSLKDAFIEHANTLQHAGTYGIDNIDYMFPDAQLVGDNPKLLGRRVEWVQSVMSGTHHTPFARIKTLVADVTADEARAKGYVTGAQKIEEVFGLLKRVTTPTTVYKKQKLDRDDMVDITDINVVAWLKAEMRVMLDEEVARAILVGDGRSVVSADKVAEANIRPIWTDDDLYTIKVRMPEATNASGVIDEIIMNRKLYRGSGNPSMLASPDFIAELLTMKDGDGKRLYKTLKDAAAEMRVKEIIEVDALDAQVQDVESVDYSLLGLIVNLGDYNIGADKGGKIGMFDDFDIDYNQYKYLIETRISGALTMPKAAMSIERIITVG